MISISISIQIYFHVVHPQVYVRMGLESQLDFDWTMVGDDSSEQICTFFVIKCHNEMEYFEHLLPPKVNEDSSEGIPLKQLDVFIDIQNNFIRASTIEAIEQLFNSFEARIVTTIKEQTRRKTITSAESMREMFSEARINRDWLHFFDSIRSTLIIYEQKTRVHRALSLKGATRLINSLDYRNVVPPFLVPNLLAAWRKKQAANTSMSLMCVEHTMKKYIRTIGQDSVEQLRGAYYAARHIVLAALPSDAPKPILKGKPVEVVAQNVNTMSDNSKHYMSKYFQRTNRSARYFPSPLSLQELNRMFDASEQTLVEGDSDEDVDSDIAASFVLGKNTVLAFAEEDEYSDDEDPMKSVMAQIGFRWLQIEKELQKTCNAQSIHLDDLPKIQFAADRLLRYTNQLCFQFLLELFLKLNDILPEEFHLQSNGNI